jgi:hypothetical protein
MDANVLLRKVQENAVSVVIVAVCAMIAFKIYNKNQAELSSIKQADALEQQRNGVLHDISLREKDFQGLKEKVNNKAITAVISSLNAIAKESEIKILYIKPAGEQSFSVYSRYPFELSITALDYHVLGKFLSRLENSRDFYTVEAMDVTEGEGPITVRLTVSTVLIQ